MLHLMILYISDPHNSVVQKGPDLSFGVLYIFNQGLLQRLTAAHSNWRRGVDWVSWKNRRLTWNLDLLNQVYVTKKGVVSYE